MCSNNDDDWEANGSDRLFSTLREWKQTEICYVALQSTYRIIKIAIYIDPDRSCSVVCTTSSYLKWYPKGVLSFLFIYLFIWVSNKMTQDNKNCVEQLLILLLFFLKSITNEQNDDDHSRQTKRENDNPWQQHCAKRLIVKKTKK
jgi:hypothetical protein